MKQIMSRLSIWIVVGFILVFAYFISYLNNTRNVQVITKSPSFSIARITSFRYEKGKALLAEYNFDVNGKSFTSAKGDGRFEKIGNFILHRSFPVIYNSIDPNKSAVLIFKSDFEKFNIAFPDSLMWVETKLSETR
jgi:hypothetical protein